MDRASPYPSSVNVSGLIGTVQKVRVSLHGFTHTYSTDVAVVLVGPGGKAVSVMTLLGGGAVSNLNLSFDDDASALPPSPLVSGSYRPSTSQLQLPPFLPAPGPGGSYGMSAPFGSATLTSTFGGSSPNGTWSLYVFDAFPDDVGAISGGWSLALLTSPPPNVPDAPTAVAATPGNASAIVSWTPPASDGGAPVTSYTVTASPGSAQVSGAASPLVVPGLTNGTSYTFTVRAANEAGPGPTSSPSNPVTPAAPGPAAFSKTAPLNGSSGLGTTPGLLWETSSGATGYEYCLDTTNNGTCDVPWQPVAGTSKALSGLASGTTYTWQVRATNGGGTPTYANGDEASFWSFTTQATQRQLQVSTLGGGQVTSSPAGILCLWSMCSANFADGTSVQLTALPAVGGLVEWGGACSGSSMTCIVQMTGDRAVTVLFPGNGGFLGKVTKTSDGTGVSGHAVWVYNSAGAPMWSATSASDGSYFFPLAPGTYFARTRFTAASLFLVDELFSQIDCGLGCSPQAGTPIVVASGAVTRNIDFSLAAGGAIAGIVTDVTTGQPINQMPILVHTTSGFAAGGVTDANGAYTVGGLPPGSYFVLTAASSFSGSPNYVDGLYSGLTCGYVCTPASGTPVVVTVGETRAGIDFALVPGAAVSGAVSDASSGAPIAGVPVSIYSSTGSIVGSAATNAQGTYTVTRLPGGSLFARTHIAGSQNYFDELYNNLPCTPSCTVTTGTPIGVAAGATVGGINFSLTPSGAIAGMVTDATTGTPLAGATVQLYSAAGTLVTSGSTSASGTYSFAGLAASSYFVRTSVSGNLNYLNELYDNVPCSPGCTVTTGTPVIVIAGATTNGINFALTPGGTVTGTVTDATTNSPLASVLIRLYSSAGIQVANTTTNASGVYSILRVAQGSYFAVANGSTHFYELFDNLPCSASCTPTTGTPIVVTAGSTASGINFALAPAGTITGTVTAAANNAPLSGVTIQFYSSSGSFVTSASTNASGVYTVSQLTPGSYFARTLVPPSLNYLDELYDNLLCDPTCSVTAGTPIVVPGGVTTVGINFSLAAGGTVTGIVTDAVTNAPVAGVLAELFSASGTTLVASTATNASGVYTISGLVTGSYRARASASSGPNYLAELYDNLPCSPTCTIATGAPIAVTAGIATSGINFSLTPGGTLAGTVTDAATSAPLAGVNVRIYSTAGAQVASVSTNASGAFSATQLSAGTYFARTSVSSSLNYLNELYANLPCNQTCAVTNGTPIPVAAGAITSGIDFSLASGGTVAGVVTDAATSAPISGATVQVFSSSGSSVGSASTNGSGAYAIASLATDSYFVRVSVSSSQNYVSELYDNVPCAGCVVTAGTPVAVTAGSTTGGVNFALSAGGTITGTVVAAAGGAPLSSIGVAIYSANGTFVRSGTTGASGAYTVTGLPAGSYFAKASSSTYVDELYNDVTCLGPCVVTSGTPIVVGAGGTTSGIDFSLASGGSITGAVTNATTSTPINGSATEIEMHLYTAAGTWVDYTYVNGSGTYSFTGLPAGSYRVRTVNFGGYIDEFYDNVVAPCFIGCPMPSSSPISVSGGASTTNISFALTPGGRVAGTVTEEGTGAPVPFIAVHVYDGNGAWVGLGETNAAGQYLTYQGLPTGTYYARTLNESGLLDELYDNQIVCFPNCLPTDGTPVPVTLGATTTSVNFALSANAELIKNGSFTDGTTHWSLFATPSLSHIQWQAPLGRIQFSRVPPPPGSTGQAVVFQNTGAALGAGAPLIAHFDLSNSSPVRKRISVLMHDSDFSDLSVCTFWLPADLQDTRYTMRSRTTKAWTNATIAFYAASTNNPTGFYGVTGVSLQSPPAATVERTDCLDPFVPPASVDPAGPDLLVNGDFGSGATAPGWATFGQMQSQVSGGVFEFIKLAGSPAGVLLQATGQTVPAGRLLTATFDLGNSSTVRKRVTVIMHDNDFSDLSACTFWIPAGQTLQPYVYRAFTNKAWTNATFSVYPATTGVEQWIRFDNATMRQVPGEPIAGAECLEPSAVGAGGRTASVGDRYGRLPAGPEPGPGSAASGSGGDIGIGAAELTVQMADAAWIADGFVPLDELPGGAFGQGWMSESSQDGVRTLTSRERLSRRGAVLRLQSWLSGWAPSVAVVQASLDGVDWQTIRQVTASDGWVPVEVDLSAYGGTPVFVRFAFRASEAEPLPWRVFVEEP